MADTATFRIGGENIEVPALDFFAIDHAANAIKRLDPQMNWRDYAKCTLEIITFALVYSRAPLEAEITEIESERLARFRELERKLSVPEARELAGSMLELWRVSGFDMGEAEAPEAGASPGIGTQTDLQPSLPLAESAPATSTESNAATPSADIAS